jgi:ABC-type transport system involved in multi-copper enzyme maturation permease subunit
MGGLIRGEWLRLRKRAPAVIIVLGVPVFVAFFFVAGFLSIYSPMPVDEAALRAEMTENGFLEGLPPAEAEQMFDEVLEQQRQDYARSLEYEAVQRAAYAFPRSIITVLANATVVFLGLILLTSIVLGEGFGTGTIRTTLLAASHRRRVLAARLGVLVTTAVLMFVLLLLIGTIAPLILGVAAGRMPASVPAVDGGALAIMLGGELLAAIAIIGFASMATLFVRSGALAFVAILVYTAVEGAVLVLLSRFPNFDYSTGTETWMTTALPIRGLTEIITVAGRAASGLASYPGEVISRDTHSTLLPLASFTVLAIVFGLVAFRRFSRMDIVE